MTEKNYFIQLLTNPAVLDVKVFLLAFFFIRHNIYCNMYDLSIRS